VHIAGRKGAAHAAPCGDFTDEEPDYVINYDIKYRMGKDAGEE